jgi:hypothetical protein
MNYEMAADGGVRRGARGGCAPQGQFGRGGVFRKWLIIIMLHHF